MRILVRGLERLPRNAGWSGARVGVLGLGRSGRGALRLLERHGADVVAYDDRIDASTMDGLHGEGLAHIEPRLAQADEAMHGLDVLVVSPGVPGNHALIAAAEVAGVVVISELELAWRQVSAAVIAVTGTNGKSTTVTLIHAFLAAAGLGTVLAGNIGTALSDEVEKVDEDGVLVVECSSFQLERIMDFRPQVAAVLNVAPDHLDRYPGFEEYAEAKHNLLRNQEPGDLFVYPEGDRRLDRWAREGVARGAAFAAAPAPGAAAWVAQEAIWRRSAAGEERVLGLDELELIGAHNLLNVTAAIACVQPWNIDAATLAGVLRGFRALPHRAVRIDVSDPRTWIDDSKATNVHAASATLAGLEPPVLLLAGGSGKGEDYRPLAAFADRLRGVICFGAEGPAIARALEGRVGCEVVGRMVDAMELADERAQPGDTVLLSPACASFDEFSGFAERGEVFANWVQRRFGGAA